MKYEILGTEQKFHIKEIKKDEGETFPPSLKFHYSAKIASNSSDSIFSFSNRIFAT